MLTVYSDDHQLHRGKFELSDGGLLPCFECPERADFVLEGGYAIADIGTNASNVLIGFAG